RAKAGGGGALPCAEQDGSPPDPQGVGLPGSAAPVPIEDLVAGVLVPPPHRVLAGDSEPAARVDPPARARAGHRYRSLPASSSTLTSLNVTTRTLATNRAARNMAHTHASWRLSSK